MTDEVLVKNPDNTRSFRKRNRESSIFVVEFDSQSLLNEVYRQYKNHPTHSEKYEDLVGFQYYAKLGYVPTTKGIYLIDTEGCGPGGYEKPCTEENRVPIPLYGKFKGNKIGILPIAEMTISKEDILDLPVKRVVNLADWVRKFGHRLEDNFRNWDKHLTPIFDTVHIESVRAKI